MEKRIQSNLMKFKNTLSFIYLQIKDKRGNIIRKDPQRAQKQDEIMTLVALGTFCRQGHFPP